MNNRNSNIFQTDEDLVTKRQFHKPFDSAPSCPSPLSSANVISSSNLQLDVDVPKFQLNNSSNNNSSSNNDSQTYSLPNLPPSVKHKFNHQASPSTSSNSNSNLDLSPRSNISPLPSGITPRPPLISTKTHPQVSSNTNTPDTNHYAALILQSRASKLNKWGHTSNIPSNLSTSSTPTSVRRNQSHHIRRGSADVRGKQSNLSTNNESLRRMRTVSVVEPPSDLSYKYLSHNYETLNSDDKDVQWVDWLDEYQRMKEAKLKSDQIQASNETLTPHSLKANKPLPPSPSSSHRQLQHHRSFTSFSKEKEKDNERPKYLRLPINSTPNQSNQPELKRKKSHQLGAKIESWWSAVKTNFLSSSINNNNDNYNDHDDDNHNKDYNDNINDNNEFDNDLKYNHSPPPSLSLPDFINPFQNIPNHYLESEKEAKSSNSTKSLLTAQLQNNSKSTNTLTALGINTGTAPSVNRQASLPKSESFPKHFLTEENEFENINSSGNSRNFNNIKGMPVSVMQNQIKIRLQSAKDQANGELEWVSQQITEYVEKELKKKKEDLELNFDESEVPLSLNDSPTDSSLGVDNQQSHASQQFHPSSYSSSPKLSNFKGVPMPRKSSISHRSIQNVGVPSSSPIRKISTHNLDLLKNSPTSISPRRASIRRVSHMQNHGSPSSSRSPSRSRSPMMFNNNDNVNPMKAELDDDLDMDCEHNKFMKVLQDLILISQEIIDTPLSVYISDANLCRSTVQRARHLGSQWDLNPGWDGRQWYIQFLLAVAGLSRIVEWWEAEKGFWNFDESDDENDPIRFVVRGEDNNTWIRNADELSPKPSLILKNDGSYYGNNNNFYKPDTPSSPISSPQHSLLSKSLNPKYSTNSMDKIDNDDSQQLNKSRPVDLDKAVVVERNLNILVDLSLDDAKFQFIAPSWGDVVGTNPDDLYGRPISHVLAPEDSDVFMEATQAFYNDDSSIKEVRFRLYVVPENARDGEEIDYNYDSDNYAEFEAKGMMMKDRYSGEFTHTMWVMKPVPPTESEIRRSEEEAVRSGGVFDLEIARQQSTIQQIIFSGNKQDLEKPILCRICELEIPLWFFERHNETCNEIHRLEMDIDNVNEQLSETRNVIDEIKNIIEDNNGQKVEYDGKLIKPDIDANGKLTLIKHVRILEHLFDGVETALDISTPGVKNQDDEENLIPIEQQRLLSPSSESKFQQVNLWQKPLTDDEALSNMIRNIENLLQSKLKAVTRMRNTIIYTEKIRNDWEEAIKNELESVSSGSSSKSLENNNDSNVNDDDNSNQDFTGMNERSSSFNAPSYYPYVNSSGIPTRVQSPLHQSSSTNNSPSHSSPLRASPLQRKYSKEGINESVPKNISGICSRGFSRRGSKDSPSSSFKNSLSSQLENKFEKQSQFRPSEIFNNAHPFDSDNNLPNLTVPNSDTASVSPSNTSPLNEMKNLPSHSSDISPLTDINKPNDNINNINIMPSGSPSTSTKYVGFDNLKPSRSNSPRTPSSFTLDNEFKKISNINTNKTHHGLQSPRMSIVPAARASQASIKDFEIIKPISKGAFGSVYLAKKKATGDYYAIKILRKADMIAKNQVTNVRAERTILMSTAESPFVAKLFFTFQTRDHLFLVMEYLNGGDCASLIKQLGGLSEEWAKRYVAEVVLCLEHLHNQGIVHRDMKPDNLLIDHKGHLRLTDFGLSKIGLLGRQARGNSTGATSSRDHLRQKTNEPIDIQGITYLSPSNENNDTSLPASNSFIQSYFSNAWGGRSRRNSVVSNSDSSAHKNANSNNNSNSNSNNSRFNPISPTEDSSLLSKDNRPKAFAGTPDYLAPETILGFGGDDMAVDWWATGVILYEFLYGIPPFNDVTPTKVFENILSRRIIWYEDDPDYQVSPEARDIMEKLLCSDPQKRLGANGAQEVKSHPFFSDIDWDKLMTMEAAFIPDATDPESTDYFDPRGALNDDFIKQIEMLNESSNNNLDNLSPAKETPETPPIGLPLSPTLPNETLPRSDTPIGPGTPGSEISSTSVTNQNKKVHDDFGPFSFKNLPVLKQANDEVIRKMRNEMIPSNLSSDEESLSPAEKIRNSKNIRDKRSGSLSLSKPNPWNDGTNPPSPSTSTASSYVEPVIKRKPSQIHSRKTSESLAVERLKSQLNRSSSNRSRNISISDQSESNIKGLEIGTPPTSISSQDVNYDRPVDVLIADDNPISLKILETLLTRLGCRCVTVRDGTEAVSCAMGDIEFDIMFFDIEMPNLNGESAAKAIRNLSNLNQNKPIIAVSSFKTDLKIQEQGVWSASMVKPVQKSQLTIIMKHFGFQTAALRQSGNNDINNNKNNLNKRRSSTMHHTYNHSSSSSNQQK